MFDKIKSLFKPAQAIETEDLIRSMASAYNGPLPNERYEIANQKPEVDTDGDN